MASTRLWVQERELGTGSTSRTGEAASGFSRRRGPAHPPCPYYDHRFRIRAPEFMSQLDAVTSVGHERLPQLLLNSRPRDLLPRAPSMSSRVNKIFTSAWLDDARVLVGTKCNRLLLLDTSRRERLGERRGTKRRRDGTAAASFSAGDPCFIPTLSSPDSPHQDAFREHSGIHAIAVNPSRRMLATGGRVETDVGFYRLPGLDPVALGQEGHSDWLFDMVWADEEWLVTGGRDGALSLWRARDHRLDDEALGCPHVRWHRLPQHSHLPHRRYRITRPRHTLHVQDIAKVRALAHIESRRSVAFTSLDSVVGLVDLATLQETRRIHCPDKEHEEMVALTLGADHSVLGVGTKRRLLLLDPRCLSRVSSVEVGQTRVGPEIPSSVRSLSMRGPWVTVGTGRGEVLFYDVRGRGEWLSCPSTECSLPTQLRIPQSSGGAERREDEAVAAMSGAPAVYTHAYDPSGLRLLTAGGPINLTGYGAFANLWT